MKCAHDDVCSYPDRECELIMIVGMPHRGMALVNHTTKVMYDLMLTTDSTEVDDACSSPDRV